MTSPYQGLLDEALADFDRRRDALLRTRAQVDGVRAKAHDPRRILEATVGPRGELRGLVFTGSAFKQLTGPELAALVVETVARAQDQVRADVERIGGSAVPESLPVERILAGELSSEALLAVFDREPGSEGGTEDV